MNKLCAISGMLSMIMQNFPGLFFSNAAMVIEVTPEHVYHTRECTPSAYLPLEVWSN